jgi:hypothetical protein
MCFKRDYIVLKWGSLKRWRVTSKEGKKLQAQFFETEYGTPEQKEIVCKMIDTVPGKIYLDWDGVYVSKKDAKKYVMEYPS